MKIRMLPVLAVLTLSAMLATTGCRSRVKPAAAPPVPVAQAAPEPVAPPERDFVVEEPEEDPILIGDLAELNRAARDRGWIRDAFFAFDSSSLDRGAEAALQASGRWLREHPQITLIIEGHCDERGTQQYNLALGDRRANAARTYLVALGIEPGRIQTVSYGEERPFALSPGEQAWSQNRRAHLVLRRR